MTAMFARKQIPAWMYSALIVVFVLSAGAPVQADDLFDTGALRVGLPKQPVNQQVQWFEPEPQTDYTPPDKRQPPPVVGGRLDPAAVWSENPPLVSESTDTRSFLPSSNDFYDGLTLFGGLDGSKQPQDLGVNANMGGRVAANWGHALLDDWGLGIQLGTGFNFSDNAVQVLDRLDINSHRNQLFATAGLFQRSGWGLNWNIVHDFLWESYYNNFQLGQWRGRVGYEVGDTDEFGVWGTLADSGDSGSVSGIPIQVAAISQVNAFWRHKWGSSAWTTFWLGSASHHSRFVLGLPDLPPVNHALVYGAEIQFPLNDWLAIYGQANFITPPSSGTVDAYLGFSIYPGGGALHASQKRYSPLLDTASNTSFAVDMSRR